MALEGHLVDRAGSTSGTVDREAIREHLERHDFFWLDLHRPHEAELELLRELFGFHPLAIEDSVHFGQRPKLEDYDDFVFLVVYGFAPDEDGLVEVHCYYSEHFLVTVRRDEAPALVDVRRKSERTLTREPEGVLVLYHVVDGLVDSFVPVLERFSERLAVIEDEMLDRPSDRHVHEILKMRRRLAILRKAVGPQRDLLGRMTGGVAELPGMTPEAERYFRDVYDHLFRLAEMIDTYRELSTGAIDVYMSAASNRLGNATKQLTVIATIFLPLTFITGFFGQNFGWMVENVASAAAFFALAIGLQVTAIGLLVLYFRRQGWF